MAESDDPNAGKPKLDASDLRAKLGLMAKKAPPPVAPKAERPVAGGAAGPQAGQPAARAVAPSQESIDEARRRSEAAAVEAGPALEDFSVVGHERTPLPAALPTDGVRVEYISVGAADSYPGQERKRRILLAAVAVAVGGVAFALGLALSSVGGANAMKDSYIREAREKDALFKANTDTVARIAELKLRIKEAAAKVREITGDPKADPSALEPVFTDLVPLFGAYVKDKIYIDPGAVMGKTMYNGELMRGVVDFAVRTVQLNTAVSDGLDEIRGIMRMAAPPEAMTRALLVERGEREVEGMGTLPVATGVWIKDSGPPQQIDLIDSTTGQAVGKEWQLKVLVVGEQEPRQVATQQVMQLDLGVVFDERAQFAKRVSYERLAEIVDKVDKIASGVNPELVLKNIQEWSAKEL